MRWRLWIDRQPRAGWANMAIDLALLEQAGQSACWVRLYAWEPHCLSFGRNEPASTRYNVDKILAMGLDTVRRPTGGRAVWHAHELTYAVAVPLGLFGSLHAAYREIHQLLAEALGTLGIAAALAPRCPTASLDAGACFSRPVGGEVLVAGRKVVGSAQLRRGTGILQHGSILLQDDQRFLAGLQNGSAPAEQSWPEAPTLAGVTGEPLSAGSLATAIGALAAERWTGDWEREAEPSAVLDAASHHFEQFRSAGWTWAR